MTSKPKLFPFTQTDVEEAIQNFDNEKLSEMFQVASSNVYHYICQKTNGYPETDKQLGNEFKQRFILNLKMKDSISGYNIATHEYVWPYVSSINKKTKTFNTQLSWHDNKIGKRRTIGRCWTAEKFTDETQWIKEAWEVLELYQANLSRVVQEISERLNKLSAILQKHD